MSNSTSIAALMADPAVRRHEVSVMTSSWIPFPFTILVLGARFYARIERRALGADDWLMLFSWVLYTVCTVLGQLLVSNGAFHHVATLSLPKLQWILKVDVVNELIGIGIVCLSKIAVALLIIRILRGSNDRWRTPFLWANIVLYGTISAIILIATATQCDPPNALWHPEWIEAGTATCPRSNLITKFGLWHAIMGAWMDFMLALLPITFIYKLNASISKKIAICCLLGLGIFAGSVAVMKALQFTHGFTTNDPTFNTYSIWFWANLEMPFVIIGGSVPPAKPVFDSIVKGIPISQVHSVGSASTSSSTRKRSWFSSASWRSDSNPKLSSQSLPGRDSSSDTDSQNGNGGRSKEGSIVVEKTFMVEHGRGVDGINEVPKHFV